MPESNKKKLKLIHEEAINFLKLFGVLFSFILFAEINLLSISFDAATTYQRTIAIPTIPIVIIPGGISIVVLISIIAFSYAYIKETSKITKLRVKTFYIFICIALGLFIFSMSMLVIDIYILIQNWISNGIIIIS